MRKFVNKYGTYLAFGALVVAAIFFYTLNHKSGPRKLTQAYFVDEETNEETVRSLDQIPPLKGASGKLTVVRVYKYSCEEGGTPKVGYYLKFSPETQAKLAAMKTQEERDAYDPTGGTLVRSPAAGSKWVAFTSQEGKAVTTIECANGFVTAVFP